MDNKKTGFITIILVSMLGLLYVISLDPIAQDVEYHSFKDQRTYFGILNFWNVISNIPFLIVGCMGIYSIYFTHKIKLLNDIKTAYSLFFIAVTTVAFGSSYYHLWPSNETLVWDRLPMAVAFMSLFSITIGEFTSSRYGKLLLWPLVIFGIYSVIYWQISELKGSGDLRLYMLVQFLPVLVIPLMLLFFNATFTNIKGYWLLLFSYILAKLLEHFDSQIYNAFMVISGHSIKHVIVALGVYLLLISFNNREQA